MCDCDSLRARAEAAEARAKSYADTRSVALQRLASAEARVRELEGALRTIISLPSKVDDCAGCIERMEWTARAALRGAR